MASTFTWIVVFWMVAALFVGADAWAEERNGLKWFLIILLTGFFGAVYYFATDESDTTW